MVERDDVFRYFFMGARDGEGVVTVQPIRQMSENEYDMMSFEVDGVNTLGVIGCQGVILCGETQQVGRTLWGDDVFITAMPEPYLWAAKVVGSDGEPRYQVMNTVQALTKTTARGCALSMAEQLTQDVTHTMFGAMDERVFFGDPAFNTAVFDVPTSP